MDAVIGAIWFLLPAGLANMAPVFLKKIKLFETPVDFGKTLSGKAIFGPHKTYRGFMIGIAASIAVVYIQKVLAPHLTNYNLIDYQTVNIFWLGFLLGFGALLGDLIKSFAKRRFNIAPGKSWVPFDQIDWVAGAIILTIPVVNLTFWQMFFALVLLGLLHPLTNLAGYWLGIKSNKF